jgi:hypothetical protein
MAGRKKKSKHELTAEREIRALSSAIERHGVTVRREKLSRGISYRVKSGGCVYAGEDLVFVDRRLPLDRQISILLDSFVELECEFEAQEISNVSKQTIDILETRFGSLPQ